VTDKLTEGVGKKIVDALKHGIEEGIVEMPEVSAMPSFEQPQPAMMQPDIEIVAQSSVQAEDEFGIEVPANVAVLKQLMSQLPVGVTKHTGAQIVRQTMEALGIPMKGVLQEAQEFQESLKSASDEHQANIAEYKKQISVMEVQIKKNQKQIAALNDIISLFVQVS
jgi:hypothetical protein